MGVRRNSFLALFFGVRLDFHQANDRYELKR